MDNRRKELLNLCGLPITHYTSHCFVDNTHQTCCILGPEARKYANSSGNPIGYVAEKANPGKIMTPWCTCAGSQVCSYYSNRFNDGTHIKFMNDQINKNIVDFEKDKNLNEKKIAIQTGVISHKTPGVGL
jgi:hypothetical protein